jgi:ABC transporter substrate binding protein (PQQ-dependent alcohol dehydrogenase system)
MGRLLVSLLIVGLCTAGGYSERVWAEEVVIGYLQLKKDPRYRAKRRFARFLTQPLGRPYPGAQVALSEARFHGAAVGATFKLKRVRSRDTEALQGSIERLHGEGVRFFVVDAPADVMAALGKATKGKDLLLFNISAREDRLRQEQCQTHLLHVIPSYAMLTDALTQYLMFRKWRKVLVLEGPLPDDQELTRAFVRSAKRYGAKIVEKRPFVLSNDPRERDKNNVALLTAGEDYDVVLVADTDGEFARNVPYQTVLPRLVVGTEGLAAAAWHWAWERHGAPQLEGRFQKKAKRPMRSVDWAAWVAVKAVAEAVQRSENVEFDVLRDYLLSPDLILDGFKGNRMSFRPWDRQLRQPLLLITHNWVVERAPIRGFLHATNNMDTLGFDERDSRCRF